MVTIECPVCYIKFDIDESCCNTRCPSGHDIVRKGKKYVAMKGSHSLIWKETEEPKVYPPVFDGKIDSK